MKIIIVGAGLSGLMAARACVETGHDVTVFDKGRSVGGRLATRRIGTATLDHGAQFFTVRSQQFEHHVEEWRKAGVIREWCRGFTHDDGHPRYVGAKGMASIAKYLAIGLDVRCNSLVFSLRHNDTNWSVITDDGIEHESDRVILTAPLPQSFSLMFSGGIDMPTELRSIDYDRTLCLLVTLDSSSHNISSPGGLQNPDEVFSFIGDNQAKGIADSSGLTFHANPIWSLEHFDNNSEQTHALLLQHAEPYFGNARVLECQFKKWRFATPQTTWPESCWVDPTKTLAIAGDAFNGPRVESAALSGLAAARALT